jgi:phosphate transport system substrate-binding protein
LATAHIRKLVPAAAVACAVLSAEGARGELPLRAGGTGSALGAMRRLADAFGQENRGDELVIVPSLGTNGAIQAVAHGAIDIGFLGRDLGPRERALGLVALP